MTLTLYFLRHGETTYSQAGGYCGALDPELTPMGVAMAQAFADRHHALPWSAIVCSPLRRAIATAKPIAEATAIAPIIRDGLAEIRFGDWEGRSAEAVRSEDRGAYDRGVAEPAWNPPTGGETAVQVADRAMTVVTEIQQTYTGNVLVVSHKATIRILLCSLLGIDLGRYRDRLDVPVASVSVVTFGRYGPMLLRSSDRNHLPSELRDRKGT